MGMHNATADYFTEDVIDDEIVPESVIAGFKHQSIDPLTGLDEGLMETWLFEDEDAEFFGEQPSARIFRNALRRLNE